MPTTSTRPGTRRLRRELSLWEVIGISVALMAPSMAANVNPQGTAGTVGRAVPLAFFLATLGVLLIAWTFVRLCRRFHHAGYVLARPAVARRAGERLTAAIEVVRRGEIDRVAGLTPEEVVATYRWIF